MDRSSTSALVSWLLIPVAAFLVQSALGLPNRPYTGLGQRGGLVATVDPGSPGAQAGLEPGDRLARAGGPPGMAEIGQDPLYDAVPGRPLALQRARGGHIDVVWLTPRPEPEGELRVQAVLLAVASIFVTLGGWVWSERRDALTRSFFLLCVSFACWLAPPPRWPGFAPSLASEIAITGINLYLPALFVQFFALFPESRLGRRRRVWVGVSQTVAAVLFAYALVLLGLRAALRPPPAGAEDLLQIAGALWFATGALVALVLFATSYLKAGSADARRRMRVALVGTLLGLGPSASLIVLRNLFPGTVVPGERWAVALTVLVPGSFAWAVVVHRIFDFRVALRAVVVVLVLAVAGTAAYALGEWWTASTWPEGAAQVSGGALAFVALAASLAGPAAPTLRAIGSRLVPDQQAHSLTSWLRGPAGLGMPRDADSLLAGACAAIIRALRLRGCLAIVAIPGGARAIRGGPGDGLPEPGPELRLRALRVAKGVLSGVDDAPIDPADREAFAQAGVSWLLPVGDAPVQTVLLLGRRLAGAWLSHHEVVELERFTSHLAIALENAELRREATSHGALERELRAAGAVQAHLLPQRVPVHPTLDCAAAVLSCEPVGGDYYDFVEGPEREFTLAVGDAAGKGMPAALLLAHVQARFRSEAGRDITPGALLGALNRDLVGLDQPEKFVGLICARVDVRNARVWVANGGMMPILVRRWDGAVEEIESGGMLLGVSEQASYPDVCVELDAGEVILVYTDGLPEARRQEEMFGLERVRAVLARAGTRRAADILQELLNEVRAFVDSPLDDLTVVVLKQLTLSPRAARSAENSVKALRVSADSVV